MRVWKSESAGCSAESLDKIRLATRFVICVSRRTKPCLLPRFKSTERVVRTLRMWFRDTMCFPKIGGEWKVAHGA